MNQPTAAGFLFMPILNKIKNLREYYAFKKKFLIDLSLSENPLGCSPKVFEVARKNISKISSYPDPASKELKSVLSRKYRISERKIALGNGSEQLIDFIPRILLDPGDEAVIPEVTFPMFENAVIVTGATPVYSKMTEDFSINLEGIKSKITNKTKLIFICNPNNPTGKILDTREMLKLIEEVQPINVIVDEANIEFGGKSVVEEVNKFSNLIVLRTFSKGYGLAGLRIGVCVAREELIQAIDKMRQPFPLNALAQKCAIAALEDDEFIRKTKKFMDNQREFLMKELRKRGLEVIDSQSNNILIKVDKLFGSSTNFIKLLNRENVSVVDGNSFRGLGDKFIRVSPRLPKTNREFLRIIDKFLIK